MGKPPKDQGKLTTHNVGLYPRELAIVHRYMDDFGISFSGAVRILIRNGARGPATSPFTPTEGNGK